MSGLSRKSVVMSSVVDVTTASLMVQFNYAMMGMWTGLTRTHTRAMNGKKIKRKVAMFLSLIYLICPMKKNQLQCVQLKSKTQVNKKRLKGL